MDTAIHTRHRMRTMANEPVFRLPVQLDFCAYAQDPAIYIRNAWTQSGQHTKVLLIGTAVALVCGKTTLLCSLRERSTSGRGMYYRLLPSIMALQEDTSLEVWPQWQQAGVASGYLEFDKTRAAWPWRWDFHRQNDALVILPKIKTMTGNLGLQISCPFSNEPLTELHPYAANGAASAPYLDRHPPVYPQHFADAWGWLLPTALWNFELDGYRFHSVWEYAVNPILRSRNSRKESILERMVCAVQHRLAVDESWRIRAQHHIEAIRLLAG